MSHWHQRPKRGLQDCQQSGRDAQAELFIVEGDSASKAVCGLRDASFQAVLPMQGKPVNASKASARAVRENALFKELRAALGYAAQATLPNEPEIKVEDCRYRQIILLFDPDADGIHCGALMLIYFYQHLRPLLEAGRLGVIRAPLYELTYSHLLVAGAPRESKYAYTDLELQRLQRELSLAGVMQLKTQRTRGLGGMRSELLYSTSIDPVTRHLCALTNADAEAALSIFGG